MGEMGGLGAIGNESDSAQRGFISYSLWARLGARPRAPETARQGRGRQGSARLQRRARMKNRKARAGVPASSLSGPSGIPVPPARMGSETQPEARPRVRGPESVPAPRQRPACPVRWGQTSTGALDCPAPQGQPGGRGGQWTPRLRSATATAPLALPGPGLVAEPLLLKVRCPRSAPEPAGRSLTHDSDSSPLSMHLPVGPRTPPPAPPPPMPGSSATQAGRQHRRPEAGVPKQLIFRSPGGRGLRNTLSWFPPTDQALRLRVGPGNLCL